MKTYKVTMKKGSKTWYCYTQALSQFAAMYQMDVKHKCGAVVIDAVVVENHEWSGVE